MPPVPQDVCHAGNNEQDAEVSKRVKRSWETEGPFGHAEERARSSWPFRYSLEERRWYVNKTKRARRRASDLIEEVGEAPL